MAMSKEQAEVIADALASPVRHEQARLRRIHDATRRGSNRPWVHIFSGVCFLIAGASYTDLVISRPKPDVLYWVTPVIFLLASIFQFAAYFWKRRAKYSFKRTAAG
jgi:uncharacterized membrane protein HdeD (DUF308 family)